MEIKDFAIDGLAPISSATRADLVEERLTQYFKEKGFVPGDPLPKEIEMAQALQVSRHVVREALSRFRMLGMIETKKRRGMVLTEPDILNGLERMLEPKMLGAGSIKDLFSLRLVMEVGMSDLLFMNKTPEDLKLLGKTVSDEEKKARTAADHIRYELEFHGRLYRMTGNNFLRRFTKLLVPIFDHWLKYEAEIGTVLVGSVNHRGLLEELKKGTPDSFRTAMHRHFEHYYTYLAQHKN
ncbi:MAG: FCD domain-containing protein [Cytophagaceae bacterium]|nr:FCD domain-containing protein [Cytophagaceae bacterium]